MLKKPTQDTEMLYQWGNQGNFPQESSLPVAVGSGVHSAY